MKLYEHLRSDLVILDLETEGVEATLRSLVERLAESDLIEDQEEVLDALLDREAVQSTAIGGSMAIPHAVCEALNDPVVALALSPRGVDFRSLDGKPVHIFFLLLSPPARSGTHIKLLARIARLVRQPGFVEHILEASEADEVIDRIREIDEQHR